MKVKIKVPETINDITLGQYQKFQKIAENVTQSEFLDQKMIEIFCEIELKYVILMTRKSVKEIVAHINSLFSGNYELQTTFKLKGTETTVDFGFIPNLDNISQGEYMDLDTYITDWKEVHKAMAVLYRPITNKKGDKYTIGNYTGTDEFAELMKFMPLGIALGAYVFFYRLGSELLNSTLTFLTEEAKELISQQLDSSLSDGDGITQSIDLLTEKYLTLIEPQSNPFTNALHFSPTKLKRVKSNEQNLTSV
jgi:hypothetical protein